MIKRWKSGPIGLDVGERHVCAAQVATRDGASGGQRLIAAARLPRGKHHAPTGEKLHTEEAAAILGTLQRQGFSGSRIVMGLPRPMLMSAVIDLPPRNSGAPLEMIARAELARVHRAAPDAMESTWWELPTPARAGGGTCAMAVGCAHAAAEAIVGPFDPLIRANQAEVIAIDARCVAMSRACEGVLAEGAHGMGLGRISAVLELGWARGELTMLVGVTPMYERQLEDAGVCRVHARLVSELSIDPVSVDYLLRRVTLVDGAEIDTAGEEAQMLRHARGVLSEHVAHVADEVRVAFSYAQGRYPSQDASRLLVVGEGAHTPGLCEMLGERTGVRTQVVRATDIAAIDARSWAGREELLADPALVTAIGLAAWRPLAPAAEVVKGVAA